MKTSFLLIEKDINSYTKTTPSFRVNKSQSPKIIMQKRNSQKQGSTDPNPRSTRASTQIRRKRAWLHPQEKPVKCTTILFYRAKG
jgi:hypothetical protein